MFKDLGSAAESVLSVSGDRKGTFQSTEQYNSYSTHIMESNSNYYPSLLEKLHGTGRIN